MKNRLFTFWIMLLLPTFSYSQHLQPTSFQQQIESLDSLIYHKENDKVIANIDEYFSRSSSLDAYKIAMLNARKGIALASTEKGESSKVMLLNLKDYFNSIQDTLNTSYPFVLDGLGIVEKKKRQFEKTIGFFNRSKAIRKKVLGEKNLFYGKSLGDLGIIYSNMARFEKAEPLLIEAIAIQKEKLGENHPFFAATLADLGLLYLNMGKHEKVEMLLGQAVVVLKIDYKQHPRLYTNSLRKLGLFYSDMEKFEKAETLLSEAIDIHKRELGEEHFHYATYLKDLARLYTNKGVYEKAEPLFKKAIAINKRVVGEEHYYYAATLSDLGVLYTMMKSYEKAEPLYIQSLDITKQTLGETHPAHTATLSYLGQLYFDMEHYEKAEPLFVQSINIEKQTLGEMHPHFANSLNNLGRLYAKLGKFESAKSHFLQAKAIVKNVLGADNIYYGSYLSNLGLLYVKQKKYDQAKTIFLQLVDIKKILLEKVFRISSEKERAYYQDRIILGFDDFKALAFDYNNKEFCTKLFDLSLFEKGLKLNASIQTRQYIFTLEDTELAKKYDILIHNYQLLSKEFEKPIKARKGVDSIELVIMAIEKEFALASSHFKKEKAWNKIDAKAIRAALAPNEVAIEFTHFNYNNEETNHLDVVMYAAIIIDPLRPHDLFIPLFNEENPIIANFKNKATLGNVKRFYSYLDPNVYINSEKKSPYDLIWAPLDFLLQGKKRIYYSPSGLLHRLNLNAIPINADEVMGNKYEMYNMLSTRSVIPVDEEKHSNEAYVVGNVNYDLKNSNKDFNSSKSNNDTTSQVIVRSIKGETWKALPATKMETENINKSLNTAGFKIDYKKEDKATEASFKKLGTNKMSPKVIHLATHGFFFPSLDHLDRSSKELVFKVDQNPMLRSGLVFAGANHIWKGNKPLLDSEDGILTSFEISHMNLSNTELVVLSACQSGLGDIQGNEGVYGLQRAFKKAGVKYIIMSLWKVSDKETAEFMIAFYQNWLEKKMSIRTAFNVTQNEMRKKYKAASKWAGFILLE